MGGEFRLIPSFFLRKRTADWAFHSRGKDRGRPHSLTGGERKKGPCKIMELKNTKGEKREVLRENIK